MKNTFGKEKKKKEKKKGIKTKRKENTKTRTDTYTQINNLEEASQSWIILNAKYHVLLVMEMYHQSGFSMPPTPLSNHYGVCQSFKSSRHW